MGTTKYRVIVTSDWHLDKLTAGVERYEDVTKAAEQIVEYAIRITGEDCRSVFVFAGDLSNPEPPRCWKACQFAVRMATWLAEACVPNIWITGNHDVMEDGEGSHTLMPVDTGHPAIHLVDSPKVIPVFHGLRLMCLPYVPRSHAYDPEAYVREWIDPPNMVVGHLMIEGISAGSETKLMSRGRSVFLPIDAIRERFPNAKIVNGHYHTGQMYRGVHIPGSIARFDLGEALNSPRFLEFFIDAEV